MTSFKTWIKAARAPFFTATIIPVLLGSILAWYRFGIFAWTKFWLVLIGAIMVHAGTNLANDYFDHKTGNDEANLNPTPFSGGSRMIQDGVIPAQNILTASLVTLILGSAIGLYLNHASDGNIILLLGITGIFLGFFYTAWPLRIGYNGLGDFAVGIGFGPLIVVGAYYVQTQHLSVDPFLASMPIAILVTLILFINGFQDYMADKSVSKKTTVVMIGKRNAVLLYHILIGVTYLSIILLIIFKYLPLLCLIALCGLPLALKASTVLRKNFDKIYELLPANGSTIALHMATGLLLCLGIVMSGILK